MLEQDQKKIWHKKCFSNLLKCQYYWYNWPPLNECHVWTESPKNKLQTMMAITSAAQQIQQYDRFYVSKKRVFFLHLFISKRNMLMTISELVFMLQLLLIINEPQTGFNQFDLKLKHLGWREIVQVFQQSDFTLYIY